MTATIEDEAVKRAELDRLLADAQAAVALALQQAAKIATRHWEGEPEDTLAMEAEIRALAPADGLAAVEALRKERDAFRRNLRETFEAMCAMRDAINEYIPMSSLESDLLQGPENSVFCTVVAQSVVAELTAQQREARRTFPILKGDGAKIDYQLVADHAEQARSNHGQSVDRLAARGGLSWCELYAVLHNRKWEKVDTNEAMIACRSLEARYLAALSNNERKDDDTL